MEAKEYREKANEAATAMQAIMAKAKTEQRELTAEEAGRYDEIDAQRDQYLASERRVLKLAELESPNDRKAPAVQPTRDAQQRTSDDPRDAATRELESARAVQAWMLGGSDKRSAEYAAAASKFGISLDQKQLNIRLAERAPRSMRHEDMREWKRSYLGVDTISPDLGGHYVTAINVLQPLEEAMLAFGGIYGAATVDRTENGSDLPYPVSNDTSNEGVIIGESVQDTAEAYPTLANVVLGAYTYSSKKVFMSLEFIQDSAINSVGRIGGMLGERIARIRNRHLTVGNGSTQPNGIVTAATTSSVTTASAAVVSYDNLVDLEHSVDPAYRNNARFMFNDTTLKILKKIKVPQFSGDTAGYPLWKPGMVTGDPDTINGYGYIINQHMASGSTQKSILFGDLAKYRVREVRDITLVRLDELYAEYRQVVFLAWARFDGDLLDAGTHPVKYLTQGS